MENYYEMENANIENTATNAFSTSSANNDPKYSHIRTDQYWTEIHDFVDNFHYQANSQIEIAEQEQNNVYGHQPENR